jgi:hypothetical protein
MAKGDHMNQTIAPEQAARARELREQGFSWEGCAKELGYHDRKQVCAAARKIRLAIDPEFVKRRLEIETKRQIRRSEWAYGSRSKLKPPSPGRPIVGKPDAVVNAAALAFAMGEIDRAELSRRLRCHGSE